MAKNQRDPREIVKNEIKDIINSYVEQADLPSGVMDKIKSLPDKLDLITNCACNSKAAKEKRERKPNERSEFMGRCMRSVNKGGEGKDMRTCSVEYKKVKEIKV